MRRISIFLVMLLMVLPVQAFDLSDEEEERLEIIVEAFEALYDLDGYSLRLEQATLLEFTVSIGGSEDSFSIELELGGDFEFADEDFAGTVEVAYLAEGTGVDEELELSAEVVFVSAELYVRVTDVAPRRREREFSDEWVSYSDDADDAVFSYLVPSTLLQLTSSFGTGFNADQLAAVTERAGYANSASPLRIFELDFDEEAIAEMVVDNLGISADEFDLDADEFEETLAEGTELVFTVWVNEEDGLPYRMEEEILLDATLDIQAHDVDLVAEFVSTQTYGDFGEAYEIEVPEGN